MTYRVALMVPVTLLACIAAPARAEKRGDRCRQYVEEVRQVERAWLTAYEVRDRQAMSRILEEGFTITHIDGSIQRKADVIAALGAAGSGSDVTYRTEQVQGRCYGKTVVLIGWVVESDGDRSRYTDTYVRIRGTWQVVASHLSRPRRS